MCHILNPREGNLCPNHGSRGTCGGREGKTAVSDPALEYSWVPSLVWQWLRIGPIEHIVFTSSSLFPGGWGRKRRGKEARDDWWLLKSFSQQWGRCGHSMHLQWTKPPCRCSRCKLCHPFGDQNTVQKNIVPVFCLGIQIWAEIACHC